MTKWERVRAALAGEVVTPVPVALWRHFPRDDATAEGLARRVVAWQRTFDFDLVKVTQAATYYADDWGIQFTYRDNREGTREPQNRVVHTPADWHALPVLDVTKGVYGRELQALRLIRTLLGPDVPILPTIFSPLTIARALRGDAWVSDLRQHPADLHAGLRTIAVVTATFAQETLRAGADAIFFATQSGSYDLLSEEEFKTFGLAYDRTVLDAVASHTGFVLLHIHGTNIMFETMVSSYGAQAVNWHDRRTRPSLREARARYERLCLVGGLDEYGVLADGTPAQVMAQVQDALSQTGGRGHILGAGCVTLVDTPAANIQAAVDGARTFRA
jgi:uroporphyrinogen decarboxylase